MLDIQKYQEAHSSSLATAFLEVFDETELPYFEDFEDSGHSLVALDRKGQIGAFILISKTEEALGSYEIKFLGVCPRHRKRGYAKSLISLVLKNIDGPLWLNVLETNVDAVRLYEHLGFKVARTFKGESGEQGVSYIMNLKCYHCSIELTPDAVLMEDIPVGLEFANYGPRQVYKLVRTCKKCMTRCEP